MADAVAAPLTVRVKLPFAMPVPVRGMMSGELASELRMVSVPARAPRASPCRSHSGAASPGNRRRSFRPRARTPPAGACRRSAASRSRTRRAQRARRGSAPGERRQGKAAPPPAVPPTRPRRRPARRRSGAASPAPSIRAACRIGTSGCRPCRTTRSWTEWAARRPPRQLRPAPGPPSRRRGQSVRPARGRPRSGSPRRRPSWTVPCTRPRSGRFPGRPPPARCRNRAPSWE